MKKHAVERGSGNVFADLGFPRPEEHRAKVMLALQIRDRIKELGLTQEEAAACTGLNQADVSKVTRGIISRFTFDRLFRCLNGLNGNVRIVVEDAAGEEPASLKVVAVPARA